MNTDKNLNRINVIRSQLIQNSLKSNEIVDSFNFDALKNKATFDKEIFKKLYFPFPNYIEKRDKIFYIIRKNQEFFNHSYQTDWKIPELRDLNFKQYKILLKECSKLYDFKKFRDDIKNYWILFECAGQYESSISVRLSFNLTLYYNALKFLGSDYHKTYIDRCLSFEDEGCFGLTELGHGSNVRELKLKATYEEKTKGFILHSDSYEAYKWWIGGASQFSNNAVIFAQLYTKGECHGVHAFVVPIRNKRDNMPYPGVIIGDIGPKVGNDGIDNGFIGFYHYRIPRENLLNKISNVSEDGVFTSSIKDPDIRFGMTLGALEEGRVGVIGISQALLLNCLTIAGRYSFFRRQFRPDKKSEELAIINYQTTQVRILPALSECLGLRFAFIDLMDRWIEVIPIIYETRNPKTAETHALLSIMKAYASSTAQARMQQLREVLGGHGYSRFNMIGFYRNGNDINNTWEGDNTLLTQQAAKFIINNFKSIIKGKKINYKSLAFLNSFPSLNDQKIKINSAEDLSINSLKKILEFKANLYLQKSLEKLQSLTPNENQMNAWNSTQSFLLQNLAKTYAENYILHCYIETINKIEDKGTKTMITKFLTLYCLTVFDSDVGILRTYNFINDQAIYIIKEEILKLCEELQNEVIGIFDVISPPNFILSSAFGTSDGKMYENYFNKILNFK